MDGLPVVSSPPISVPTHLLTPPPLQVDRLVELLSSKKMGVVAHFYMDPEVRRWDGGNGRESPLLLSLVR